MTAGVGRRAVLGGTLSATALPGLATAQDEAANRAPFGLTWGSSVQQVQAAGAALTEHAALREFGRSFEASNLGRVLVDTSDVFLSFGWRDRLIRLLALSRPILNDPHGGHVLARYGELVETLANRYGAPRLVDERDTGLYKAPGDYVASLRFGRALRFAEFSAPAVRVQLFLRAQSNDAAGYGLLFEHKPGMMEFEADKKARERDAL